MDNRLATTATGCRTLADVGVEFGLAVTDQIPLSYMGRRLATDDL